MNKQNKAGEPAREVRVAVACTGASGEPEMPVFTVRVTDLEFDDGQHYLKAQEMAEDDRYEGPFVCFDDHEQGPIHRAAAELASVKTAPEWTVRDQQAARNEGWGVFDRGGQLEIQRLDESPKNLTDAEAVHGAYTKALRGSELHRKAMSLTLTASNVSAPAADVEPASDAALSGADDMPVFTIFVQQADGRGTVHISAHAAATREAAVRAAIAETLDDWDWLEHGEDSVHVLGAAAGDVEILAWDDLDF